jgi:hypothetical protein
MFDRPHRHPTLFAGRLVAAVLILALMLAAAAAHAQLSGMGLWSKPAGGGCMTGQFDFSSACNSGYAPIL